MRQELDRVSTILVGQAGVGEFVSLVPLWPIVCLTNSPMA